MINSVGSAPAIQSTPHMQSTPPPANTQKASPPQDTVHLSAAAQAAAGDVDHDGDSH